MSPGGGAVPSPLEQSLQYPDQRQVGGRHIQTVHLRGAHPLQRGGMARLRHTFPFPADIEQQQQMPVAQRLELAAAEARHRLLDDIGI